MPGMGNLVDKQQISVDIPVVRATCLLLRLLLVWLTETASHKQEVFKPDSAGCRQHGPCLGLA